MRGDCNLSDVAGSADRVRSLAQQPVTCWKSEQLDEYKFDEEEEMRLHLSDTMGMP